MILSLALALTGPALASPPAERPEGEWFEASLMVQPGDIAMSWTVQGAEPGVLIQETIETGRNERLEVTLSLDEVLRYDDGRVDQVALSWVVESVQLGWRGRERSREVVSRPRVTTLNETQATMSMGSLDAEGELVEGFEFIVTPYLDGPTESYGDYARPEVSE